MMGVLSMDDGCPELSWVTKLQSSAKIIRKGVPGEMT